MCEPMKTSARPVTRSADISTVTIAVAHIRALTTATRIKPTSIFLRSARRPNPEAPLIDAEFLFRQSDQFRHSDYAVGCLRHPLFRDIPQQKMTLGCA
jgi:hypothetical protein